MSTLASPATSQLQLRQPSVPAELLSILARRQHGKYTDFVTVYYAQRALNAEHEVWIGVVGDGDNGAYECFFWNATEGYFGLTVSEDGWGSPEAAFRAIIEKELWV